jgi:hypothetical protein
MPSRGLYSLGLPRQHAGPGAARMGARDAAFLADRLGNLESSTTKGVLDE